MPASALENVSNRRPAPQTRSTKTPRRAMDEAAQSSAIRAQCPLSGKIRHRLSQRPAAKYRRPAQPITRDLELIFLYQQLAGFLTCRSTRMTAFPIPPESVAVRDKSHALLAYSDEIAQDFHLFPFYPHSAKRTAAPAALYSICSLSYH